MDKNYPGWSKVFKKGISNDVIFNFTAPGGCETTKWRKIIIKKYFKLILQT